MASQQEENFDDAKAFKPERWLSQGSNTCPFLAVPFGAGKRLCPGKRIAEYEMLTLTAKVNIAVVVVMSNSLSNGFRAVFFFTAFVEL